MPGLHDDHGNANEWAQGCYVSQYRGTPADSRPRYTYNCVMCFVRSGSWKHKPWDIRSARRHADETDERSSQLGFRVMRTFGK